MPLRVSFEELVERMRGARKLFVVVAASTRTSTIPGISIAGPSPEATLYTPTLDVEYLLAGKPLTLDVIPVTPEGIPTPALVTRAALSLARGTGVLVVDAGCAHEPRVAHAVLPSRTVGGRIDVEDALPRGTSRRLFEEARLLGRWLARGVDAVVIGETMPGGTTTAAAILEALGYPGVDYVSSASPRNPRELKKRVVSEALRRLGGRARDVFEAVDVVGDPLHVSVAGLAAGAAEHARLVVLAGGTQMASVAAILAKLGLLDPERYAIATTRWLLEDSSSSLDAIIDAVEPRLPVAGAPLDFSSAPYPGLRAYEEGYVKEGVGMGGAVLVALAEGASVERVVEAVIAEYERVARPAPRG